MEDTLTQLGLGAIVALQILDKVLPYIAAKRNGKNGKTISSSVLTDCKASSLVPDLSTMVTCMAQIDRKVDDLHNWHAIRDEQGVPLWYGRTSVKSIERLVETSTQQTVILQQLLADTRSYRSELMRLFAAVISGQDK